MLRTDADGGVALNAHDLEFFQTHFIGKPMASEWKPPAFEVMNKSKPVRDFISWMLAAPVLSERAVAAVKPLIERHVEFLPLTEIKRKPLYAVNVLNVIDCLDIAKSDIVFSPSEPGRIVNVHRFVFDPAKLPEDPLIFKVADDPGCVFVSQGFVDVVILNQLTGSLLVKPHANPFSVLILASPDVLNPVHTRTSQK